MTKSPRRRKTSPPYTPPPAPKLPTSPTLILIERILDSWDRVSHASKRVECALPRQMSEAIEEMIETRGAHERLLVEVVREEHTRIRGLADIPILLFYGGKTVEEMDVEQLRDALEHFSEDRKRLLGLDDSRCVLIHPTSSDPKRTADALNAFAQRAAERLKELTS